MTVRRPTVQDLTDIDRRLGLGLTPSEVDEFVGLVNEGLGALDWLDLIDEEIPTPLGGMRLAHHPTRAEDPLGAWYCKASINTGVAGPLSGRSIVVKDNICVAGIPMMNGCAILEGYVPERDATVVERVLQAGGTIVGKAVSESLSYSGGSHTSDTGPVRNPYDLSRSCGGSSSGCAALLASGEVDLAIGGDQGGSIRCPSAWSGVYGLKPTFGLVPYTAAFPLEMTLDHLGPMARSSADLALLLGVIAGADGLDPRQGTAAREPAVSYSAGIGDRLDGLRLGVLAEGFGWDGSEPDVDEAVRAAAAEYTSLGAEVVSVSVPLHRDGGKLMHAIVAEGSTALLIHGDGAGTNWRGLYVKSMADAFARGRRARPEMLPAMLKLQALVGQWLHDNTRGQHYAKAQNIGRQLRAAYDNAFAGVDLLALPTTPQKATKLPSPGISSAQSMRVGHTMGWNTAPFNVTGHPALSLPCASSEGLPVGLMLVGRHGDERTLLRAAHAFETKVFRLPPPTSVADRVATRTGADG